MRAWRSRIAVSFVSGLLCAPLTAQVTLRVSVSSRGAQGDHASHYPSISADGRFVAFSSDAGDLVPGDSGLYSDVFVRDRLLGTTERVSVAPDGSEGNWDSGDPSISASGRYVAFRSGALNLIPGDTNIWWDVFVHDRASGTNERVSVSTSGAQSDGSSWNPSISGDGRYVGFWSFASNLVPGDTNGRVDVFVHDRQSGTTERVSIATDGTQGNDASGSNGAGLSGVALSADGRWVAFFSYASNLVLGDTNGLSDVFVHDRRSGLTERVSVATGGAEANGESYMPSISSDGRYVAFTSIADNLVPGDTNSRDDVFIRDRWAGTTERLSVSAAGVEGDRTCYSSSISSSGRCVAFLSHATNLVPGDTNAALDVFVRDLQNGTIERVSIATDGTQGNNDSGFVTDPVSISSDGRYVAFESFATDLVPGDTNGSVDTFVRDRAATGFASTCEPGAGGAIGCPCSNPPSGAGLGCDNSSSSGGARLSAVGIAYLSMDSLVFTTSGEKPTALSIVMQGNAAIPAGVIYGQGVRCFGGTIIRRLFIKEAVAGSITAPELGSGDATVSARSAAKGDVIQPGESRYYLVYYRDPIVLGGCPATSTFNATQTGRVEWSP